MPVHCYAARAAKSELTPFSYEPAPLGAWDAEIRITHCGICHSDLHLIHNDWGVSQYPLVPGHEVIGTVSALGSDAAHLAIGQRVGVGWQRGACMTCEWCVAGKEHLCPDSQATCLGHPGGFADAIRVDARFAFPIPDGLASHEAAPLLCGGITVYEPLSRLARPAMRVGVIGIGGLGHLAVQFARAMGCEVVAFSTSARKADEARQLGAHHFVDTSDPQRMRSMTGHVDLIVSTVCAGLDWGTWLDILRPQGHLCLVGVAGEAATLPVFPLIGGQKSVSGSPIGSRGDIAGMLAFAARHGVRAWTEVVPMAQVNAALGKLAENRARYRMVLQNG